MIEINIKCDNSQEIDRLLDMLMQTGKEIADARHDVDKAFRKITDLTV
jgi:hypothetical protein